VVLRGVSDARRRQTQSALAATEAVFVFGTVREGQVSLPELVVDRDEELRGTFEGGVGSKKSLELVSAPLEVSVFEGEPRLVEELGFSGRRGGLGLERGPRRWLGLGPSCLATELLVYFDEKLGSTLEARVGADELFESRLGGVELTSLESDTRLVIELGLAWWFG